MAVPAGDGKSNGPGTPPYLEGAFGTAWSGPKGATLGPGSDPDRFLRRPVRPRSDLVEIRWHGRGGQGAMTAGELLAQAALLDGKFFQSFPEFSAERTGAPVVAYTRLSASPINIHSPILEPDIVVVLDPTLAGNVDMFAGLRPWAGAESYCHVFINSPLPAMETQEKFDLGAHSVHAVDATRISEELLDRNLPNVPMLGALLHTRDLTSLGTMVLCIQRRLSAQYPDSVVNANILAFKRGYAERTSSPPQQRYRPGPMPSSCDFRRRPL